MKTAITGAIEEVRYNGGHSTRKPSTVTMTVSHKFAIEVADLMEDYIKAGIEPEQGLLRLELIAVYADPEEDESYEIDPLKALSNKNTTEERPDDSEAGEIVTDLTVDVDEVLDGVDMEADSE